MFVCVVTVFTYKYHTYHTRDRTTPRLLPGPTHAEPWYIFFFGAATATNWTNKSAVRTFLMSNVREVLLGEILKLMTLLATAV